MITKKIYTQFKKIEYVFFAIKASFYSKILLSCGSGLKFWGRCNIKNPQNIELGSNVSFNDGVYLNALGGIIIGDGVAISANAIIVSTTLDPDDLSSKKHINKSIIIGSNVQIGAGAIILPGVEIGSNVMVGAGCVVSKNIPNNCIVVGNPARILKRLKST